MEWSQVHSSIKINYKLLKLYIIVSSWKIFNTYDLPLTNTAQPPTCFCPFHHKFQSCSMFFTCVTYTFASKPYPNGLKHFNLFHVKNPTDTDQRAMVIAKKKKKICKRFSLSTSIKWTLFYVSFFSAFPLSVLWSIHSFISRFKTRYLQCFNWLFDGGYCPLALMWMRKVWI